jgi:DNA modification methylase
VKAYYADDTCTIYHGDCMEVLPDLAGVDLVFTSPPYNMGISASGRSGMHAGSLAAADLSGGYGVHDDAMPEAEYDEWQTEVVAALWRTLSDAGAIFYNHKPRPWNGTLKLPLSYGHGLPLRQIVVWDRGTGLNFSASHFLPKCEWIVVWAKPEWRLRDRSASQVGDVWRVPPDHNPDHPCPFPLILPATAISVTEPRLVLDPFMGTGTTLRAAKDHGVRAIGIERSERYCELAAQRLAQEVLPL